MTPTLKSKCSRATPATGMHSAIDGICDIGMASRAVKDSEIEAGLTPTTIALDGLAVSSTWRTPWRT